MYNTGDILIVHASIPFMRHLAIVFYQDGKPFVSHNMPGKKKDSILIEPLDEFLSSKKISGVISTDGRHTDQEIYNRSVQLNERGKRYHFLRYNCEDFVRDMCGCSWGVNQRKKFIIALVSVLLLGTIIYLVARK